MKTTQQDMARLLNIDPRTLRNWRKTKPYLYEIIQKGFAMEKFVQEAEKNLQNLKSIHSKQD